MECVIFWVLHLGFKNEELKYLEKKDPFGFLGFISINLKSWEEPNCERISKKIKTMKKKGKRCDNAPLH